MEEYPPNPLATPPRHDPSLASLSTDPTNSYQHCSPSCREYHNVFDSSQVATNVPIPAHEPNILTYPSTIQQAALAALQKHDKQVILAWLTGLRSFKPGENHWFQPKNLSSREHEAVFLLKDCPDGLVSAWLDITQTGGAFDGPQRLSRSSQPSTNGALLHNSWQGSSNPSRSSGGSLGTLSSLYDSNTVPTTPASSRRSETFLDLSTEPSIDEASQPVITSHGHWCFVCHNPRIITTCDGWKRHMKEHEARYRCMPKGPIEHTADGAKCAFCGLPDPSQSHCETHKAYPCANKSWDVRSYTRKPHFITHLKTHQVTNCAELADRWKDTIDKKHFSCGFCVAHFHTLIQQLNHIDVAHYRLFQNVRDWDFNNVIRGLLLQPGVAQSWQCILGSKPDLKESFLHWDSSMSKKLQFRLEIGTEPAETLAEVALNESTYDSSHQGEARSVNNPRPSHRGLITTTGQIQVMQTTAPARFIPSIAEEDILDSSASHVTQHGWPPAALSGSISPYNHFPYRSGFDMFGDNARMGMQHSHVDSSQTLMMSGGNARMQPYPSPYASWTFSTNPDSNSATQNSVMMADNWQAPSLSTPTNSSLIIPNQPRFSVQTHSSRTRTRYANPDSLPILTAQGASSPLKQSSSLLTPTGPNLAGQPSKQSSCSKLKAHYDINTEADTGLDFDILQRLMREEDSTRSERRNR